ncbi:MAG: hypothetical protein EOR63_32135 [Mesorhizobium sp.]|nr:MAG: hypothetical protein EOR63_32135 [Mesorhizobium sp.]
MKAIIDDINASMGHLLAEQGLMAVYEYAPDPGAEDDLVHFVSLDGSRSIVYLQVNSLHPSLEAAEVNLSVVETRELPFDGWKIVETVGVMSLPGQQGKGAVLNRAAVALRENAGAFDVPEGVRHGLLSHPMAGEAFDLVSRIAAESGDEISVRPYVSSDAEGFQLSAADGRAARVELRDGLYQVTALGERMTVPFSTPDRGQVLEGLLTDKLGDRGPRP